MFHLKWILPTLITIMIADTQFGQAWVFFLIWTVPWFIEPDWFSWLRADGKEVPSEGHYTASRPLNDWQPLENSGEGVRRVIRTSDGEFMTAIEDPESGMLILENEHHD